jgi:hypothetical protein
MGFWDSISGQDASAASNAAAQDQYGKQKKASQELKNAGNQYKTGMFDISQGFNPYVNAGGDALSMYRAGLGLDGGQGSQAFTQAYQNIPGYSEGLKTGQDSAIAARNASGRLNSGAAFKALQQYGSDYENQRSGDYLSRLFGLSGMGQQATGQQVATQGQGLQGQLGARTTAYGGDMQAAGTIGQGMIAGANAEQQGLTNLMSTGASLAGAALGGGMGGGMGTLTNLFKQPATAQRQTSFASPWAGGIPQQSGLNGYGGAWG